MLKKYIFYNLLNFNPIWIKKENFKKIVNVNEQIRHKLNACDLSVTDNKKQYNNIINANNNTDTLNPNEDKNNLFSLKESIKENLIININTRIIYQITKKFCGENLIWITLSPKISNFQDAIKKTKYYNLLNDIIKSISIKNNKWQILHNSNRKFIENLNNIIKDNNINSVIILSKDILQVININQNNNIKVLKLPHPSLLFRNPKIKNKIWEKLYLFYKT